MNVIAENELHNSPTALCLGETMVMLVPQRAASLTEPGTALSLQVGGAESNVAMGLAQLGLDAAWWSRLGDDSLGRFIKAAVERRGVDVHTVTDPDRRTGIYFKDVGPNGTRVVYYRDGSAASAMAPSDVNDMPPWSTLLHLSGITPALSPGADALIQLLLRQPRSSAQRVSFDINHRPQLWKSRDAAARLHELAQMADIVFVGLDEAYHLWGTESSQKVRELFPDVPELVIKDGPRDATTFIGQQSSTVPAPKAEVVELVGAGDAFAAGYLAATLRQKAPEKRLVAGHLCALRAIQSTSDVPELPQLDELLSTGPEEQPSFATEGALK